MGAIYSDINPWMGESGSQMAPNASVCEHGGAIAAARRAFCLTRGTGPWFEPDRGQYGACKELAATPVYRDHEAGMGEDGRWLRGFNRGIRPSWKGECGVSAGAGGSSRVLRL